MGETLKTKLQRLKLIRRVSAETDSNKSDQSPPSSANTGPDSPALPQSSSRSSIPAIRRAFSYSRPPDDPDARGLPSEVNKELSTKGMTDRDAATPPPTKLLPALTVQHPTPEPKPADAIPPSTAPIASKYVPAPIRPLPPPTPISRSVSFRPTLSRANTTDPYIPSQLRGVLATRADLVESPTPPPEVTPLEIPPKAQPRPMGRRKIWVRRPGASATLVQIGGDDLVDDVRDMILRKYANSLGRNFDSPDVTLRIIPSTRSQHVGNERVLGPEEPMCTTLDAYFPGGQTVNEALVIDVPQRRTPKHSPRPSGHHYGTHLYEEPRPAEEDTGYFPPMPPGQLTPREQRPPHHPHSIGILETGQVPALPSPRERKAHGRPRMNRQQTSSPSSHGPAAPSAGYGGRQRSRRDSNDFLKNSSHAPNPPPLPSPPVSESHTSILTGQKIATPPIMSPNAGPSGSSGKTKKPRRQANSIAQQQPRNAPPLSLGTEALLNGGAVPPINVLLVEDNIINLKLLEMFVKRLKVRWSSVMNGRDAVNKWREGGFHLVLMDIQLPIMNGLEATKAIRRLERVNGIGVFARSRGDPHPPSLAYDDSKGEDEEGQLDEAKRKPVTDDDKLPDNSMFKSPVIIVALTASSLQSDRHEALAAGCNDFLTKPVNFPWFERKVMEWGCMQALIDFDGWRTWKAFDQAAEKEKEKKVETEEERIKREKKEAKKLVIMAKMGQA